jgi:hypothetical protein
LNTKTGMYVYYHSPDYEKLLDWQQKQFIGLLKKNLKSINNQIRDSESFNDEEKKIQELQAEREQLRAKIEKFEKKWEDLSKGGKCSPSQLKHGTDPDKYFNKSQLKQGVKTELEHTDSRALAKAIAKAHLTENKAYYTKLKRARL